MSNSTPAAPDDADGASGSDRLTEPADGSRQPRLPFPVVGVGASAGGLEAYSEFLKAARPDAGLAYVLIQHLPPDRESLLVELLARHTPMPVAEVTDGQAVEPDHVYVIRPGHTLTIRDGHLHLGIPVTARGHGRPIDDFFRSLAEEQQQRAIAVILSGMGSNGTAGAEAVEAVGGLVVAQDPETAHYPSMPRNLIDANLADFVLRPSEIPDALARYAAHPYVAADRPQDAIPRRDEQALAEILGVLRARTRHDFAGYRKPTLVRRILRRMGLAHVETMGEYAKALRRSATEVVALADDMLIHVTGFFRDPDAWEALREKVIEPLAEERPDGASVRAWVTACATGEEAYSLAMLLVEASEKRGKVFDIKVFATDMAERALGHARSGVFPGGIESEVTPERLERFFDKDESTYRIKRALRELVIFAPQNVLQDPPFSRLDIVTCRNLLIYLEPEVQRRVLSLLHFGLREGGALLLGTSESVGSGEDEFQVIDKKHRLFRRVGPTRHGSLEFPLAKALAPDALPTLAGVRPVRQSVAQVATRTLLEVYTPAAVVVDFQGQIVYYHGDTGRYLDQPRGEPSRDLLALANEQVRGAVRTALHRATELDHAVSVRDGLIDTKDGRRRVEVGAAPLDHRPGNAHYLITFRDYPEPHSPPPPGAADPTAERQLVEELQRVRDELQSTLEEMQTSSEEMKASHEEVTSINEELQSTNEELETSKEELQSLNEELTTVNAQLQAKMSELEATTNDLGSLLTSTDIAVLFLDQRFRIRRYTPAVKDLLDLIPSDAGRPLADLRRKFADPDLLPDAQAVLDKLVPRERGVRSESGREYVRRVLPYRTADNRIDGVVVTFVDVTARQRAEAALAAELDAMTRLHDLSERLLAAPDLPAALGLVLDTAIALHRADMGTAQVYDPATGGVRFVASRGFDAAALAAVPVIDQDFHSTCAAAIRTGARVVAADIPADPTFAAHAPTAAALGYRAAISTPLVTRKGEFRGVLTVHFRRTHAPTERDLRLADLLAHQAAHLIGRRHAEDALRASEERFRAVAANLPNAAVFVVGPDLRYQLAAGEALNPAGIDPTDLNGKALAEALPANLLDEYTTNYRRALAGETFQAEHAAHGRHYITHGVPLRDAAEAVTAALAVSYDITDRKQAEAELRATRDELELRVTERTAELAGAVAALEEQFAQRKELSRRLGKAEEAERLRVSRELHDEMGQHLAALILGLNAVEGKPGDGDRLRELRALADRIGRELHRVAVELRPTALDDLGLYPAIQNYADEWVRQTGVRVELHLPDCGPRLPPDHETTAYRIIQEALTNVRRHAAASRVGLVIERRPDHLLVIVEDDGRGFDPDAPTDPRKLGVAGMRERAALLGGTIEVESSPGAGTTVFARLPLAPA